VTKPDHEESELVDVPVRMDENVFTDLTADLRCQEPARVLLVADENTYQACGKQVEDAINEASLPIKRIIFPGQPLVTADETSIVQVLQALGGQAYTLAAVGSGTITDVVRYVAYQTRLPFVSIPTATSVDAYTSYNAAITLQHVKYSIPTKTAQAIYAHLPTLCAAPRRLTASGFGDMVAKYTALADWKLAHILTGDLYHDFVAQQAWEAVMACVQQAEAIGWAEPQGIATLFKGLSISGRCMATLKSSRPAAGAEHSLAHFWEINHQLHHLPESLHGEKTGVASTIVARLYEQIHRLSAQEAALKLEHFNLPDPQVEATRLRTILGPTAEFLIAKLPSFLGKMREKFPQVKANLLVHWDRVQAIASTVPTQEEIVTILETAGALSEPAQIHVQTQEVELALENAMYVRDRLTILELNRMLGLTSME
jgi:glycerol-1-phosphate dehydrogenase [NAD(P)+]